MDWMGDSKTEEHQEHEGDVQMPARLIAFYIAVALLPVVFLFGYLGKFHLGLNVFICLFVNVIAVRTRWRLRKYLWFWLVVALVMALEVPVVLMVKWPQGWGPGVALLPIALAGYLIAMGAVKFAEKIIVRAAPSDEGE
jgi:hypothetical protein